MPKHQRKTLKPESRREIPDSRPRQRQRQREALAREELESVVRAGWLAGWLAGWQAPRNRKGERREEALVAQALARHCKVTDAKGGSEFRRVEGLRVR